MRRVIPPRRLVPLHFKYLKPMCRMIQALGGNWRILLALHALCEQVRLRHTFQTQNGVAWMVGSTSPVHSSTTMAGCECGGGYINCGGFGACVPVGDDYTLGGTTCPPKYGNPIYPLTGTKRKGVVLPLQLGGQVLTLGYDCARAPWTGASQLPGELNASVNGCGGYLYLTTKWLEGRAQHLQLCRPLCRL